jgi:hypothetical protein
MAHRPVRAAAYPVRRCGRRSRRPLKQRSGGRALRMRVGGLVRHRVARMHAQAHAGRRRHARARAHRRIHTEPRRHMRARSTNAQVRTHKHTSACAQRHQRVHTCVDCEALLGDSSACGGNRTPSSCGSDARESGRLLLLLVCVAPASRVRRTRRCPQQTSAGSDVARETAGSCARACVSDGLRD